MVANETMNVVPVTVLLAIWEPENNLLNRILTQRTWLKGSCDCQRVWEGELITN